MTLFTPIDQTPRLPIDASTLPDFGRPEEFSMREKVKRVVGVLETPLYVALALLITLPTEDALMASGALPGEAERWWF